MVEWSCRKERLNERRLYIFVEWSRTYKINKSVGTLNSGRMFVRIASAKVPQYEGASHHTVFMDNCPTMNHTVLALSTQWMSSAGHWRSRFPFVTPVVVASLDRVSEYHI